MFVFFIEGVSTVSLKLMLDSQSSYVGHMVWFIIIFPFIIAFLFFGTLWFKRESIYGPTDFKEDSSFLELTEKVEERIGKIELRQEAYEKISGADTKDFLRIVKDLVDKGEIYTALQIGRIAQKERRHENSRKIFEFLKENVTNSHKLYSRIFSNLAYALVSLKRYEEAITILSEVREMREEGKFYSWHAITLAYSYFKIRDKSNYSIWMDYAKNRPEFKEKLNDMIRFFPEIKDDLLNLKSETEQVHKRRL